jgi:hypothetical protein
MNFKNLLTEDGRRREVIRTMVKDIITVYKEEDDGEFYLPNYINDEEDFYNFQGFENDVILQLTLIENPNLNDFKINGDYWKNEDIIDVSIEYNPNNKFQILYDLVGQLNQLVGHEIRHVDQKYKKLYNLNKKTPTDSFKYYSQPEEIDAQYFGFNRLSKLSKTPLEKVIDVWFEKNQDLHNLNSSEVKKIKELIINYGLTKTHTR